MVLEFEATGMQVVCVTGTLAAQVAVERFERRIAADKPIRGKDVARLARVFVQHVVVWNVTRKSGALVPLTRKGVLSLDKTGTLLPMLQQWAKTVAYPPKPTPGEVDTAPDTVPAVDPDEAMLAALEARTLTEPGETEQLVTVIEDKASAPALEPV